MSVRTSENLYVGDSDPALLAPSGSTRTTAMSSASGAARESDEAASPQPAATRPDDAVTRLERELKSQGLKRWGRRLLWLLLAVAVVVAFVFWRQSQQPPPAPRFRSVALEVRDIVEQVDSTGRLKPLKEVTVGAQVSGRVVNVAVDFNSVVKEGDLLAEIDPQLLGAQVDVVGGQLRAAEANLQRASSTVSAAQIELERLRRLTEEGIASQAELDQAKNTYNIALAEVSAAKATIAGLRAQLHSARTTLTYAKIYSPIDGVVIHREVEPGQTVASSFTTPVLFIIAEDLSQMQVLAEIDEADVGKLKEGLRAQVTVDAFMGETFDGVVTQIRYSPNEVQGVVTYSAVISVANPELKLRPGMTATVAITTREANQVLAAPNAALRFQPEDPALRQEPLRPGKARLYQVSGGAVGEEQLSATVVDTGISDGLWTAIEGPGLERGDQVVTEQTDKREEKRRFMGLF